MGRLIEPAARALAEAEGGTGQGARATVGLVVEPAGEARGGAPGAVEAVREMGLKGRVATETDVAEAIKGGVIVTPREVATAFRAAIDVGPTPRRFGVGPAYAARAVGPVAATPVPGGEVAEPARRAEVARPT